jgi:flagellar export protein FliJ
MHSPESRTSQRIAELARFLFSLDTLLRHRENVEQKEREELLRLTYNYQLELRNRDVLTAKFQETLRDLSLKRTENSAHQELNWFYLYLNRLTHEIGECEKRLSRLQSEVQAQKEVVIEASKKKKIIATMKAKKQKEYVVALEKQEQKEVDELVIMRHTAKEPDPYRAEEGQQGGLDVKPEFKHE